MMLYILGSLGLPRNAIDLPSNYKIVLVVQTLISLHVRLHLCNTYKVCNKLIIESIVITTTIVFGIHVK